MSQLVGWHLRRRIVLCFEEEKEFAEWCQYLQDLFLASPVEGDLAITQVAAGGKSLYEQEQDVSVSADGAVLQASEIPCLFVNKFHKQGSLGTTIIKERIRRYCAWRSRLEATVPVIEGKGVG